MARKLRIVLLAGLGLSLAANAVLLVLVYLGRQEPSPATPAGSEPASAPLPGRLLRFPDGRAGKEAAAKKEPAVEPPGTEDGKAPVPGPVKPPKPGKGSSAEEKKDNPLGKETGHAGRTVLATTRIEEIVLGRLNKRETDGIRLETTVPKAVTENYMAFCHRMLHEFNVWADRILEKPLWKGRAQVVVLTDDKLWENLVDHPETREGTVVKGTGKDRVLALGPPRVYLRVEPDERHRTVKLALLHSLTCLFLFHYTGLTEREVLPTLFEGLALHREFETFGEYSKGFTNFTPQSMKLQQNPWASRKKWMPIIKAEARSGGGSSFFILEHRPLDFPEMVKYLTAIRYALRDGEAKKAFLGFLKGLSEKRQNPEIYRLDGKSTSSRFARKWRDWIVEQGDAWKKWGR